MRADGIGEGGIHDALDGGASAEPPAGGPASKGGAHRVVIIGGGFGGLAAARGLRDAAVEVLLVDRHNYHLFQPLLYQVATAALSPANIAIPLRSALSRQRNARVVLGEVVGVDLDGRRVRLEDGSELPYDSLVVSAGSRPHYFGHAEWEPLAPGLKTLEDATEVRRRILLAFESAEREADRTKRLALLTFVVVGGGPTGVELAGAIAELARDVLRHEYRTIAEDEPSVLLVEGSGLLDGYPGALQRRAARALERLGVRVREHVLVTAVDGAGVELRAEESSGVEEAGGERIASRVVLWAAGVRAESLAERIATAAGMAPARGGSVRVEADLSLPGYPEVHVVGDMAYVPTSDGRGLPGVAPVALQEGAYAARRIRDRLEGHSTQPFRYREQGKMATVGRGHAVAQLGWLRLWGLPGWLVWLVVHLMQLATFQNRALVLTQWAFHYFTHNRAARLVSGVAPAHLRRSEASPAAPAASEAEPEAARGGYGRPPQAE